MESDCPIKSFVTPNYPAWIHQQADACSVRSRLELQVQASREMAQQLAAAKVEIERLTKELDTHKADNARLRKCVETADDIRSGKLSRWEAHCGLIPGWENYDRVRQALAGKVEKEGDK